MSLLGRREIRNQMFVIIGMATLALTMTTILHESQKAKHPAVSVEAAPAAEFDVEALRTEESPVNWDDVNLVTGHVTSPEDEVKTARGKMLGDFEAR